MVSVSAKSDTLFGTFRPHYTETPACRFAAYYLQHFTTTRRFSHSDTTQQDTHKYAQYDSDSDSDTMLAALHRMPLAKQAHGIYHRIAKTTSLPVHKPVNTTPSQLHTLETSLDPRKTLHALASHRYTYWDLQYLFLLFVFAFSFEVIREPGSLHKVAIGSSLVVLMLIPATSQIVFNGLPVLSWLVLFYACRFIPADWRPHIWVSVLPTLENILYGANLSDITSKYTHPILDVLAWIPYGFVHFAAPVIVAFLVFSYGPPRMVRWFAKGFGYMNLTGVIIQLLFPCAPPWYEILYGISPANYSMPGSPGGLARVDALFGTLTYTTTFTASPLVFGAFPSLHSGFATYEALFLSHMFPKLKPFFWGYVGWVWWSTMYLTHHYFVDLIGGSCLAVTAFFIVRQWMPTMPSDSDTDSAFDYAQVSHDENTSYYFNPSDIELGIPSKDITYHSQFSPFQLETIDEMDDDETVLDDASSGRSNGSTAASSASSKSKGKDTTTPATRRSASLRRGSGSRSNSSDDGDR